MERIRLLIAAVLIACGLAAASQAMVFPGEDWKQVRPEAQGVDSAKLKEAVSYLKNNSGSDGVKADGKRKWPDAPVGTYAASGCNNNNMFVIGKWNMVIVRLGLDQRDFPMTDTIYNTFLEKIGEAIEK